MLLPKKPLNPRMKSRMKETRVFEGGSDVSDYDAKEGPVLKRYTILFSCPSLVSFLELLFSFMPILHFLVFLPVVFKLYESLCEVEAKNHFFFEE
jgi:hypothetical protein